MIDFIDVKDRVTINLTLTKIRALRASPILGQRSTFIRVDRNPSTSWFIPGTTRLSVTFVENIFLSDRFQMTTTGASPP